MPELSPYSSDRVNGKVLVSFRRPKGFHAVVAFPGICCLTDQYCRILCYSEEDRKHVFPLFALAVPCQNKGEEQEAAAKQTGAGQDGICLLWGSTEMLIVLLQLWQSV